MLIDREQLEALARWDRSLLCWTVALSSGLSALALFAVDFGAWSLIPALSSALVLWQGLKVAKPIKPEHYKVLARDVKWQEKLTRV